MYTQFFGLTEKPFSITPDPRYLYMSQRHADALAHLLYGISESGGFIQLTGEVGTGKTTLVRSLFEQLPEEADVALILNPELTTEEFLTAITEELGIDVPADCSVKALIDGLNTYLLDAHGRGRRTVLIVDEAQNLGTELLEQVRLLTNLETPKQKLLQIILIGQPELREVLSRDDMRQVAQRITGRYHLQPLNQADTTKYVKHRMRVAGASGSVFRPAAIREIYRRSKGVPRLINVVADRALLAGYAREARRIDRRLVRRAAAEVFGDRRTGTWWRRLAAGALAAGLAGAAAVSAALWVTGFDFRAEEPPAEAALAPAPAPQLAEATEILAEQAPVDVPRDPVDGAQELDDNARDPADSAGEAVDGIHGHHAAGRTAGGPGRAERYRHRLRDAFRPVGNILRASRSAGLSAGTGTEPSLLVPARFIHLPEEPGPAGHIESDRRRRRTVPGGAAAHGHRYRQPRVRRTRPSGRACRTCPDTGTGTAWCCGGPAPCRATTWRPECRAKACAGCGPAWRASMKCRAAHWIPARRSSTASWRHAYATTSGSGD